MASPEQKPKVPESGQEYKHGQGLGSLRTTKVFRAINFELYAKPVSNNILLIVSFFISLEPSRRILLLWPLVVSASWEH